jgi:PAS domain-containing protein
LNALLRRRWQSLMQRSAELLLPPHRYEHADPATWLRASLLAWTTVAITMGAVLAGLAAQWQEQRVLVLVAALIAILAGGLLLRFRQAPQPRAHAHTLLVLTAAFGGLLDAAAGGTGFGALALSPLLLALAILLLPRWDAGVWCGLTLSALLGGTLLATDLGRTTHVLPLLTAAIGLALLLASRVSAAYGKLQAATDLLIAETQSDNEATAREDKRLEEFIAMPGDWYWETDADFRLTFLSPELVRHLAITEGVVLGRTLDELLRSGLNDVHGLDSLARSMRTRLAFSHYLVASLRIDGSRSLLWIRGWRAHAGNGLFLGYRGAAREVFDPRSSGPQAVLR